MSAKQIGYVLSIFLLFFRLVLASSNAETFEIKFSPGSVVYRGTLAEDSQLFDCMLQDLAGNSGKGDETKPESFYAYGQTVLHAGQFVKRAK